MCNTKLTQGLPPITLGLPSTTLVHQTMPKQAFYMQLKPTTAIKNEFTQLIDHIELLAALKETSTHLLEAAGIQEIDVLALYLKTDTVPLAAIKAIVANIPRKLLLACVAEKNLKLLLLRNNATYETEWLSFSEAQLVIAGATLAELWDSLCSQVVFGDPNPEDFLGRAARAKHVQDLKVQLATLEKKRQSERQIGRRNAMFDQIRTLKRELNQLEEGR